MYTTKVIIFYSALDCTLLDGFSLGILYFFKNFEFHQKTIVLFITKLFQALNTIVGYERVLNRK